MAQTPRSWQFITVSLQVLSFFAPLVSMFWRAFYYRLLGITRGLVGIYLLAVDAIEGDLSSKKTSLKIKKEETQVTKFARKLDALCIHGRGQSQALPSFVRLYDNGFAPLSFVLLSEVNYHLVFYAVYVVTMHVPEKTKKGFQSRIHGLMLFFKYSDIALSAAFLEDYLDMFSRAITVLVPQFLAFLSGSDWVGAGEAVRWQSEFIGTKSKPSLWKQLAIACNLLFTVPTGVGSLWWSEVGDQERQTVVVALLGLYVAGIDIYATAMAGKLPPLITYLLNIQSAAFYTWASFQLVL